MRIASLIIHIYVYIINRLIETIRVCVCFMHGLLCIRSPLNTGHESTVVCRPQCCVSWVSYVMWCICVNECVCVCGWSKHIIYNNLQSPPTNWLLYVYANLHMYIVRPFILTRKHRVLCYSHMRYTSTLPVDNSSKCICDQIFTHDEWPVIA